jgi:hypothetical protein
MISEVRQDNGTLVDLAAGKSRQALVSQLHGKHYTKTKAGNLFVGNTAVAGAVVPIYSNTTQQYGVFNPLGSGVDIVPVQLNMAYIDTTGAAGAFCLGYVKNCGAGIATGSPGITAATTVAPINLRLDGPVSKAVFMSAAVTTAAPSLLFDLGINQLVTTATDATNAFFQGKYEFDGTLVVPQGTAIFFAGHIAVLIKLAFSLIWEEVPA